MKTPTLDEALESKREKRNYVYETVNLVTGRITTHHIDSGNGDLFLWELRRLKNRGIGILMCRAYPLYLGRNF